jgi:hypothetical protein
MLNAYSLNSRLKTSRIKTYLISFILTLAFCAVHSQSDGTRRYLPHHSQPDYSWPSLSHELLLSYHPKDFLTRISVYNSKDSAGKQLIDFVFDLGQRFIMRLDSVTLESENAGPIVLHVPVADSLVIFGGKLVNYLGVFSLSQTEIDFLREQKIKKIIFDFDNSSFDARPTFISHKTLPIILGHRSRDAFMEVF